jgi:hypothetical protein
MTLRGDDRAVAVQIGAVILLGFLVVSLSLYQATVVPNENQQVELQHSQRVQSDMLEVRNAILGTAATGSAAPATVELGTRYPTRAVAVNPAPPSGTLSTSSLGQIVIDNATANDPSTPGVADYPETEDFWNGSEKRYNTTAIEYRPSYANYNNPPTTVYENGLVYNRFQNGNVTRSEQSVVAGTRISLVALSGELSRGGTQSLLVDPQPVSVSTRTISVSNNSTGENVSVVVPSELTADEWRGLLNETGDYDENANLSNGAYVYDVDPHSAGVKLYFEPKTTYQLKLSKIGVGRNTGDSDLAYLTSVEDLEAEPLVGQTYPFVVESRDRYNNPTGTGVEANVPSGTVIEPGQYRYQYDATSVGRNLINVTYLRDSSNTVYQTGSQDFNGELPENVQYEVNVQAGGGGGGSGGGFTNGNQSECTTNINAGGSGGSGFVISFDVTNSGNCDPITITEFGLAYESNGNDNVRTLARKGSGNDPRDRSEEVSISGSGEGSLSSSNKEGFSVNGQFIELDSKATIATSGTSNINFGYLYFESSPNGNDPIEVTYTVTDTPPADARYFTVKLLFGDGTVKEVYFKVTNINS